MNLRKRRRSNNNGFTLVELAIVLVIIGIILGAILKGQDLIQNAKAKRVLNDLKGWEALLWTYYDRYGHLPDDDNLNDYAATNWRAPNRAPNGYFDHHVTERHAEPIYDLRTARLISSSADVDQVRLHAFGDSFEFGVVSGWSFGSSGPYNVIAIYNIPRWAAEAIDVAIDGGADGNAGRVRRHDNSEWSSGGTGVDDPVTLYYFFDRAP